MNDDDQLFEIQGAGEGPPFSVAEPQAVDRLCPQGIRALVAI